MADEQESLDPFAGMDPWGAETDVEHRDARGRPESVDNPAKSRAGDQVAEAEPLETITTRTRRVFRRVMGERQLEEALPDEIEEGVSVHVVSHGDVDFTSYLLWLCHRQRLRRLAVSTWAMSMTDAEELRRLVRIGRIERLDAFCGEHAERNTPQAWLALKEVCRSTGGRAVLMRNHAKIAAWQGFEWDGAMESSANLASNVSMEQTCLTRSANLARFYLETFDKMDSMTSEV